MNGLKFSSLNYITAVAKNLRLSPEQQAILDEKLKLSFPKFWFRLVIDRRKEMDAFIY